MKYMKSTLYAFIVSFIFSLLLLPSSPSADPLDNWHLRTSGTTNPLYGVTYGNGIFVAVGYATILTSPDGATWTDRSSGYSSWTFYGVAYGNGIYVAVGTYNVAGTMFGGVLTSPDGINWTQRDTVAWLAGVPLYDVAYGNNTFVATGGNGIVLTSPDGITTWQLGTPPMNSLLGHLTYANNVFVAIDNQYGSSIIYTSADGQSWVTAGYSQYLDKEYFERITYGNNMFVAVGSYFYGVPYNERVDDVSTSPDLATWTRRYSGWSTLDGLQDITYGHCKFVAVGEHGHIVTSPDGMNWTQRSEGSSLQYLESVAYGNNTFVTVGISGMILQSDPVSQTFDFDCDNEGWRGLGLFDDLGLNPIPGWFVNVPAPWNNGDGDPAPGVIGAGTPSLTQFPASPTGAPELHADLLSPDLSSYTQWQGITSFSYNVTGKWIVTDQPLYVLSGLWVKMPDGSVGYYWDALPYYVPTWGSGIWETHTVDVTALGIPADATITNVGITFIFLPSSWVYGFTAVDHVVPTKAGALTITPSTGLTSSGSQGGPFSPSSASYTLQNTGATSINWTASKGQTWVTLSSTSGTLAAGASKTVTVSINSNANSLNPGSYSDTVSFTNTTNGNGNTTRPLSLTVTSSTTSDLIISSLTGPSTATPGSIISITDTTKNQGTGTAGASTTRFYWSSNSTWDASDIEIGSRSVPALAAGATSTVATNVTVPPEAYACSGAGTMTFYIIAKADADGVVPETNEANNTKSKSIKTGPDLIVSAVTASTISGAGKTITVGDTTKNNGGCPAGASTTKYYLSTNSAWDVSDIYLGSRLVGALAAGATNTGSASVTIPSGTPTGTYYIIAKADANGVVSETTETNNTKSKSIKIGPDLIISALTAPTSAARGSTISITDTTKNSGGGNAGASTTKLYLSTNSTWDAGDTYLGQRAVTLLVAGASSAGATSVTIPSGIPTGTYYIIAVSDANGVVIETNETNNNKSKTITIN